MKKFKDEDLIEVAYITTSGVKGTQMYKGSEFRAMLDNEEAGVYDIKKLLGWVEYSFKIKEDESDSK